MSSRKHNDRCKRSAFMAPKDFYACKPTNSVTVFDVLERGNMFRALKRVQLNKGCPGIDGITVEELPKFLINEWQKIRKSILEGNYSPKPVKTVHIPKPQGGTRMLGIPTVLDRLIQQAIQQVLSSVLDPQFSDYSYGFRTGRSAHQAVLKSEQLIKAGYRYTVDLDLEKFFDNVCHDRLMAHLSKYIRDKKLLLLIRRYLQAGMMSEGVCVKRERGTPQGSPLSPLLSNLVLDELDKELERRGHKFCRYADDCNIYIKSLESGERVFKSIRRFIENKLKLRVNSVKSAVSLAWKRSFLGYSVLGCKNPRLRCSKETIARFKHTIRKLTRGHHRSPLDLRMSRLNSFISGWCAYFRYATTHGKFRDLDSWIRSRLRMCMFKRWPKPRTRVKEMLKLGLHPDEARGYGQGKRYWHLAQLHHSRFCMNNAYWEKRMGFRGIEWNMKRFAKI